MPLSARRIHPLITPLACALVALLVACGGSNETRDAAPPRRDAPPATGQFGDDCLNNSDCVGGYCVEAVGGVGGVCTRACNDDCPQEWTCREVTIDGAPVRGCIPDAPQLCLACADDAECGTGAACLTIDNQKVCATECSTGCPTSYTCAADPAGTHPGSYCQPTFGSCTCTAEMDGASRACTSTNGVGTCFGTQMCASATGWSACSAPAAAVETCDGDDNDCDFLIDEDTGGGQACSNTVAGIGTCPGTRQCGGSVGYVCEGQLPSAEICNYADEDCDSRVDETFPGIGTLCSPGVGGCQRFGSIRCGADGTASECSVTAGSPTTELCNQVDDDCDTRTDETFSTLGSSCSAGSGTCQRFGTNVCASGGMSTTCSVTAGSPMMELCNGLDDDCDNQTDETFPTLGNGCMAGTGACQRFGTTVCASGGMTTRCSVTAGAPGSELCNQIDDDCDTRVDETFPTLGNACSAGLGACQRFGTTICASGMTTTCSATAGTNMSAETCNYFDDDCSGTVDNGFRNAGTGAYDMTANCGSCGNDCTQVFTGANSTGQCSVASGSPKCVILCSPGTSDLNSSSFDGCEFVLDNTSVYVSITDPAAADDSTCGLGPTGSGTGNHPCRTITFGLTRATTLGRPNVRVADGTYNEAVTLVSGTNLYGAYRPGTWDRHLTTTSTLIQGATSVGNHDRTVVAISVTNVTFEGFVVRGSYNSKSSGNSYAIYVSGGAASLVFKDNQIFAGRGGPGLEGAAGGNGATGPAGTGSVNGSYNGFLTSANPCSTTQSRQFTNGAVFSCGGQSVNGGNGGGNRCPPATNYTQFSGISGFAGMAGGGAGGGAGGSTSQGGFDGTLKTQGPTQTCFLPGPPMEGADGASGGLGSNGAGVAGCSSSAGTVSSGEWVNGGAATGTSGFHGGGGGGGAGGGGASCTACTGGNKKDRLGAHGGGGGAGGCGGTGGGAGSAGGGVFGIFIVGGTAPTLTNNTIERGAGGTGGDGGIGGAGGIGGRGGDGGGSTMLCSGKAGVGGTGGEGGDGSGGGGGCGGSSYGIFTSGIGTPAYCTGNAVSPGGSAGSAGAGGFSGGSTGGNGTAGVLQGCTSI